MPLANAAGYPLWANILIFAAAGVLIWVSGARLTRHLDAIALKTGLDHAFVGMLLLGGITSLPEVANTVTASAIGNPALAVNNLLGSAAINVLLLAVVDGFVGRKAVTSIVAQPSTMMMAALCMIVLILIAGWMVARWLSRWAQDVISRSHYIDETLKPLIVNFIRYAILAVTVVAVMPMIRSSPTSSPRAIVSLMAFPSSEPLLTASRRMSPVETLGIPCSRANRSACVPLPAPGGPRRMSFTAVPLPEPCGSGPHTDARRDATGSGSPYPW